MTVEERWMQDDDPDNQHHKWKNGCLSCHAEDYEPFSPQLLHYCVKCGQICVECEFPKPIFAFPYNVNSEEYKAWRLAFKAGRPVGRAPREAHIDICNHCQAGHEDDAERAEREAQIQAHRTMMDSPDTKDALRIMMGG